jgi:hypothetical protein
VQDITADCSPDKQVISTKGTEILCNNPREYTHNLLSCQHEEADTRLLMHAKDAANQGHNKVIVCTMDTDVVVLALGMIQQLYLDELWVAFGAGKNLIYISVHGISEA